MRRCFRPASTSSLYCVFASAGTRAGFGHTDALLLQMQSRLQSSSTTGGGGKDAYSKGFARTPPSPAGVGKSSAMIGQTDWKADKMPEFVGEQPPGVPPSDIFGEVGGAAASDFKFQDTKNFVVRRSSRRAVPGLSDNAAPHTAKAIGGGEQHAEAAHGVRGPEHFMPERDGQTRPLKPPQRQPELPRGRGDRTPAVSYREMRAPQERQPMSNRFHDDAIPGHRNFMSPNESSPEGDDDLNNPFGKASMDPKSVRFSPRQAAKEEHQHLRPPEVRARALPKSYLDLDNELDDATLNTKLGSASTRDGAFDEALGVAQPAQRRAVPKPPKSRLAMQQQGDIPHTLHPDDQPSENLQSVLNPKTMAGDDKDKEFFNYDWFQNKTVRNMMYNATPSYVPPDAGRPPGFRVRNQKRGALAECKRLFSDYDWGDRKAATHVLFMYPWGEWMLSLLFVGITIFAYNYQIDNHMFDWYDEFLGFDFRIVPGAEAPTIMMFTVYLTYVFARHPAIIFGITINRLWRIFRGKPMGPP